MAFAVETHRGSAQVQKDGSVTLTRTFRLDTGNVALRPAWGVALIGIYKYNVHPDDATCRAIEVNSQPVEDLLGCFDVSYTYSNRPFDAGTTDDTANGGEPGQIDPTVQPNPTLRTPTVRWSNNIRTVPLELDYNPNGRQPVANSAKQPFEGFEAEAATGVMTISFNTSYTLNVKVKQATYLNTVNDAGFVPLTKYGAYAAGKLRCNRWDGTLQFESGYGWFIAAEVELEFNRNGWERDILDQGYYELVNTGTEYVQQKIIDKTTGFPVDAPVKLNGNGRKLEPNTNPAVNDPFFVVNGGQFDVAVYKKIYPHEWVTWTNIFA